MTAHPEGMISMSVSLWKQLLAACLSTQFEMKGTLSSITARLQTPKSKMTPVDRYRFRLLRRHFVLLQSYGVL